MIAALVARARAGSEPGWLVQTLSDDGSPQAEPVVVTSAESLQPWDEDGARWLWDSAELIYPPLLAAGFSPSRCHDVTLTERILLGREERHGAPAAAAAVYARRHRLPVPNDPVTSDVDAHRMRAFVRLARPSMLMDPTKAVLVVCTGSR